MKKKAIFWQDAHRLRVFLSIVYILLIILDMVPFLSLFFGIFIFLASAHRMPDLEKAHFIWLRKTLLIYFLFTGFAALIFIFSPAQGASVSSLIIFFIGFLWVEFREIKGLICLWKKRDPSQGINLFEDKRL